MWSCCMMEAARLKSNRSALAKTWPLARVSKQQTPLLSADMSTYIESESFVIWTLTKNSGMSNSGIIQKRRYVANDSDPFLFKWRRNLAFVVATFPHSKPWYPATFFFGARSFKPFVHVETIFAPLWQSLNSACCLFFHMIHQGLCTRTNCFSTFKRQESPSVGDQQNTESDSFVISFRKKKKNNDKSNNKLNK